MEKPTQLPLVQTERQPTVFCYYYYFFLSPQELSPSSLWRNDKMKVKALGFEGWQTVGG